MKNTKNDFIIIDLSGSEFPSSEGFMYDSTGVRCDYFFWIIGGDSSCNNGHIGSFYDFVGQGNKNSYLWHIEKKKWVKGPKYHNKINKTFHYSCAVALNKSAILFTGLVEVKHSIGQSLNEFEDLNDGFPNKYNVLYNFNSKLWIEQESLDFRKDNIGNFEYMYSTTCVVNHGKKDKRYNSLNQKQNHNFSNFDS